MAIKGLIVLLAEAVNARDEKSLRKDWQKDMRGLLAAAVKQNKRAYTKRAAAPVTPKKADTKATPAQQLGATNNRSGSGGSEVSGPKGGNTSAGFSGSIGGFGGGGSGYGGGGSGGGGGIVSMRPTDLKAAPKKADAYDGNLLADMFGASFKEIPQEKTKKFLSAYAASNAKYSRLAKRILDDYGMLKNGALQADGTYTAALYFDCSSWMGTYSGEIPISMPSGTKDWKAMRWDDAEMDQANTYTDDSDVPDVQGGETVDLDDLFKVVSAPKNPLPGVYSALTRNDGYIVDSVLADYKDPVVRAVGKALRRGGEWDYHWNSSYFSKKTGGAELDVALYVSGGKYYSAEHLADLPGPQMYVTLYAKDDSNDIVAKQIFYRKKGADSLQKISMESAIDLLVLRSKILPADKAYDAFAEGNPKPLLKMLSDAGGALAKIAGALEKMRPTSENLYYIEDEPVGGARYRVSAMPFDNGSDSGDVSRLVLHFDVALPKANAILSFTVDTDASGKIDLTAARLHSAAGYEHKLDIAKVPSLLTAG